MKFIPKTFLGGAFTLASTALWFPNGAVFVAVIDPGVGSSRAILAVKADGQFFIAPDNGVLGFIFERARRLDIVRLTNKRYWLPKVSSTFQGRDVMAPVASYLAQGGSLHRLGPPQEHPVALNLPKTKPNAQKTRGEIIHIDRFGNLVTNLRLPEETKSGSPLDHFRLRYRGRNISVVSSYANGRLHELVSVVGSLGFLELAVREGSAARFLRARKGECVDLVARASQSETLKRTHDQT